MSKRTSPEITLTPEKEGTIAKARNGMTTARSDLAVIALQGKLYAMGGYNIGCFSSNWLRIVERYDPESDNWEIVAPMVAARRMFAAAAM